LNTRQFVQLIPLPLGVGIGICLDPQTV
jgi:hypothetical protein